MREMGKERIREGKRRGEREMGRKEREREEGGRGKNRRRNK